MESSRDYTNNQQGSLDLSEFFRARADSQMPLQIMAAYVKEHGEPSFDQIDQVARKLTRTDDGYRIMD